MNKRDEELFDQLIRHAAGEWLDEMTDDCPADRELNRDAGFSSKFLAWADKTAACEDRRFRGWRVHKGLIKAARRAGIAVCVLAALLTLTAFTVPPVRVALSNYLIERQEGHIELHIGGASSAVVPGGRAGEVFGYLPKGYAITNITENEAVLMLDLEDGQGGSIHFQRQSGASSVGISGDVENVAVDGLEGVFSSERGQSVLVFHDDKYNYLLNSTVSRDELFRIAENIRR
jgi:hypothetical protein